MILVTLVHLIDMYYRICSSVARVEATVFRQGMDCFDELFLQCFLFYLEKHLFLILDIYVIVFHKCFQVQIQFAYYV